MKRLDYFLVIFFPFSDVAPNGVGILKFGVGGEGGRGGVGGDGVGGRNSLLNPDTQSTCTSKVPKFQRNDSKSFV